jgi:hypothetical protein
MEPGLVGKPEVKRLLEDLSVDGMITPKLILRESSEKAWTDLA